MIIQMKENLARGDFLMRAVLMNTAETVNRLAKRDCDTILRKALPENGRGGDDVAERLDFIERHDDAGAAAGIEHVLDGENVGVATPFVPHGVDDEVVEFVGLDGVVGHLEGDEDVVGAGVIEDGGIFGHEGGLVDGGAAGGRAGVGREFVEVGAILEESDFFFVFGGVGGQG